MPQSGSSIIRHNPPATTGATTMGMRKSARTAPRPRHSALIRKAIAKPSTICKGMAKAR